MNHNEMDAFTRAFFECALWSSTDNTRDDGGDPLDKNYSTDDIDDTCMRALAKECTAFQLDNMKMLHDCSTDMSQHGHDFWLTRNGHGVGFWDRGYGAKGDALSDQSKVYGTVDLYVGDDGKVYAAGYEGS